MEFSRAFHCSISFIVLVCCALHSVRTSSLRFEPAASNAGADKKILACYYRPHNIPESMLPPDVCTHIIFAFGTAAPQGILPEDKTDPVAYRGLAKLKEKNPHLKIMISLQRGFPSVINLTLESKLSFSLSAVKFLNEYNFDGVDLDFEFPDEAQKQPYSDFITVLGSMLHASDKLLSLAMPAFVSGFERGYVAETVAKYPDFMTVMTYDYHAYSKRFPLTGFNSPLFSPKGHDPLESVIGAMFFYELSGIPTSKLLLGYPTYGRSWKLANASNHGVGARAVDTGDPGPITKTKGYYLFQDICTVETQGGVVEQDDQYGAEYLYHEQTWVAFNGLYSAELETAWLKESNFGGIGVWTLENDDPHDQCGLGPFPVLTKVRRQL